MQVQYKLNMYTYIVAASSKNSELQHLAPSQRSITNLLLSKIWKKYTCYKILHRIKPQNIPAYNFNSIIFQKKYPEISESMSPPQSSKCQSCSHINSQFVLQWQLVMCSDLSQATPFHLLCERQVILRTLTRIVYAFNLNAE